MERRILVRSRAPSAAASSCLLFLSSVLSGGGAGAGACRGVALVSAAAAAATAAAAFAPGVVTTSARRSSTWPCPPAVVGFAASPRSRTALGRCGRGATAAAIASPSTFLGGPRRLSASASAEPPPPAGAQAGVQTDLERTMTNDALSIVQAGIDAVDPRSAVLGQLSSSPSPSPTDGSPSLVLTDPSTSTAHSYRASDYDDVLILSFGKASSAMALAAADAVAGSFPPEIKISGIAIVKDGHATAEENRLLPEKYGIQIRPASHPIPDARSVSAATDVLNAAMAATDRTLVLCCISGGGSALFCSPRPPLILDDLAATNASLLASGMSINGMNVIRKRLELGKGGRLAAAAFPATVATLVLSDIVGDPLDLIASGPTVPDDGSGFADAAELVREYGLGRGGEHALPPGVLDLMEKGLAGETFMDTPKSSHPVFCTERQQHQQRRQGRPVSGEDNDEDDCSSGRSMLSETVLVGNNRLAVTAAAAEADRLGYNPVILGTTIEGEARDVAGIFVSMAEQLHGQKGGSSAAYPIAKLPAALIGGGETTVTLTESSGRGGRNQEIGLAAAIALRSKGLRDVVLASIGTDGTDGPTDAAGAIVDGGTIDRVERLNGGTIRGEEALRDHDAYTFFDAAGEASSPLVRTGPTGTNVADVCITLVR